VERLVDRAGPLRAMRIDLLGEERLGVVVCNRRDLALDRQVGKLIGPEAGVFRVDPNTAIPLL